MNKTPQSLLAELQARVSELFRSSPAADIERNLKAMLAQTFQRVDLVTRDDFDLQLERLSRLQERVDELERKLGEREAGGADEPSADERRGDEPGADEGAGTEPIPMPGPEPFRDVGPTV